MNPKHEAPAAEYVYCCCQPGAEKPLKQEVAARAPALRFAFSRPGFVTFKLAEPTPVDAVRLPRLIFARAQGVSLGKLPRLASLGDAASKLRSLSTVTELVAWSPPQRLQVWQRDVALPGDQGVEPGPTPLAAEARRVIEAAAPAFAKPEGKRPSTSPLSLDIVLVEPNEWWIGCHALENRVDRWPGGVPPIPLPDHAVSRAYLKMKESLAWGHLTPGKGPAAKGDTWIELGCAPGGASQALLDAGMSVLGVDPAEVDTAVAEHPRFRHLQMRAGDARRSEFADARWLAADINAAPQYTLDAVESVVGHKSASIRGLVLTLKLPSWDLAAPERMLAYFDRIRGWGYRDIRARQLAHNRREVCVVALRSRGQRRMRR